MALSSAEGKKKGGKKPFLKKKGERVRELFFG